MYLEGKFYKLEEEFKTTKEYFCNIKHIDSRVKEM